MRECDCKPSADRPTKAPEPKPQKPDTCVQCGGWINPKWAISLENTRAFLARLEDASTRAVPPIDPDSFERFEAQVLRRQQEGEARFRQSGHGKDMVRNGNEELTDAVMYAVICLLQERRGDHDEHWDIALEVGYHCAAAFELYEGWKAKERGRAHAAKAHDS